MSKNTTKSETVEKVEAPAPVTQSLEKRITRLEAVMRKVLAYAEKYWSADINKDGQVGKASILIVALLATISFVLAVAIQAADSAKSDDDVWRGGDNTDHYSIRLGSAGGLGYIKVTGSISGDTVNANNISFSGTYTGKTGSILVSNVVADGAIYGRTIQGNTSIASSGTVSAATSISAGTAITAKTATNTQLVVGDTARVGTNCVVNSALYGGTIQGNTSISSSGTVAATTSMSAGTAITCTTATNTQLVVGDTARVGTNCVVNSALYGGTIQGNTSIASSGTVSAATSMSVGTAITAKNSTNTQAQVNDTLTIITNICLPRLVTAGTGVSGFYTNLPADVVSTNAAAFARVQIQGSTNWYIIPMFQVGAP